MALRWRHCILNARCSWLHGHQRGFRSRGHRIHSSGNYKNRPPVDEHAGLRRYHRRRSGQSVDFNIEARIVILEWFVRKLRSLGFRVIAASLGAQHLHVLVELPWDFDEIRRIMGKCKQRASHAVRKMLPGSLWSEGGEFKWIKDKGHLHNTYKYIREKQESETVVWSHRDDENWIDNDVDVVIIG